MQFDPPSIFMGVIGLSMVAWAFDLWRTRNEREEEGMPAEVPQFTGSVTNRQAAVLFAFGGVFSILVALLRQPNFVQLAHQADGD